jgi:dTMP kinase
VDKRFKIGDNMKGKFITFEGGEGSGKTSVWKLLQEILPKEKYVFVNDPSKLTNELLEIRRLLLSSKFDYCNNTELLLYGAARAELVHKFIKPALNKGKCVISDRFLDSTFVYQGKLKGHHVDILNILNRYFAGNLMPERTFLFDVNAKIGLTRSFDRLNEGKLDEARWEKMGFEIHKKINKEYRKLADNDPERFIIVNSNNLTITEMLDSVLEDIIN